MNALVSGSDGFVGRHLIPKLQAAGYTVYPTEDLHTFLLTQVGMTFDVIVHLAANIVNVDQRARMGMDAYEDIGIDRLMCRYIEKHPPRKMFVAMSSCAVDFPADPYCIVKRTLEAFCTTLVKQGVPVTVLRPFSGYGPDQSLEYPFPAIFARAMQRMDPLVIWSSLSTVRDWIHIDDLTDAIMLAVDGAFAGVNGQPVEIGTGVATPFVDLARLIASEFAYAPIITPLRDKIGSAQHRVANTRRAAHFGFRSKITLAEGIRRAAEYYKERRVLAGSIR